MPAITISQPSIGLQARFSFKDPADRFVKSRLNTNDDNVILTVVGVSNMKEMIEVDMSNPYLNTYQPIGLSDFEYQEDLANQVPLVMFKHTSVSNKVSHFRIPLNYIEAYSHVSEIEYINKLIVIDLGSLPKDLDTTVIFEDLSDTVSTLLGVTPEIKEVNIGETQVISQTDHVTNETVRGNLVTVRKTLSVRLAEITLKHDQILQRLSDLNISLS